jgi:hypothetical protein
MIEVMAIIGSALTAQLTTLTALALRLHWQASRDRRRQDTLSAFAARLPPSSAISIHDVRDDGSQLRMHISTSPQSARERDVRSRAPQ